MDRRIIKYNWEDIARLEISKAHVTIELIIEGKGLEIKPDSMCTFYYGSQFTLSDHSKKIDTAELQRMLRHMAVLQGAVLKN